MKKIIFHKIHLFEFIFVLLILVLKPPSVLANTIGPLTGETAETFLNPVYLPLLSPDRIWKMASSYDQSGSNHDNWDNCPPNSVENGKCVLVNLDNKNGIITRIWYAQPIDWPINPPFPAAPVLEIYNDKNNPANFITLNLADLAKNNNDPSFPVPFLTDARLSSGGLISLVPIPFTGRLKILSTTLNPGYFQINYTTTSNPVSNANIITSLAPLWDSGNMGQSADNLSNIATKYQNIQQIKPENNIPAGQQATIFNSNSSGTITKLAFPASGIENRLNDLWLKVTYSDNPSASTNLPLNMVFVPKKSDWIPDLPPTNNVDSYTIAPTGKEIIVKDDSVWIKEPYLENYKKPGTVPNWYRVNLATWLSGPGSTKPPTDKIDVYSIDQNGGEHVIKGGQAWARPNPNTEWYPISLDQAWPGASSNGYPLPHDNIEACTFALDGRETVISGGRYWSRPTVSSSWWSDTIESAWGPGISHVDGYSWAYHGETAGETVISGNKYWYRTNPMSASWQTGTLENAWKDPRSYQGSLFFGYDPSTDEYYLTWPIPFWGGINVSLENKSQTPAIIPARIFWSTDTYNQSSAGYLNIAYNQSSESSTNPLFIAANLSGKGKLVGIVLKAAGDYDNCGENCGQRTFLEGDDEEIIDDFPVGHGTGTEDFFNGGWYFTNGPFYLPTHGAIKTSTNRLVTPITNEQNKLGKFNQFYDSTNLMYRHFLNDAVEFDKNLKLTFEFGPEPKLRLNKSLQTAYEGLSIAYLAKSGSPTPTPIPGVTISDLRFLLQTFTSIFDYNSLVGNYGHLQ